MFKYILSKMYWTAELGVVQTLPLSLELHLVPHKKDSVFDPCLIHGCYPWPITTKVKSNVFYLFIHYFFYIRRQKDHHLPLIYGMTEQDFSLSFFCTVLQ